MQLSSQDVGNPSYHGSCCPQGSKPEVLFMLLVCIYLQHSLPAILGSRWTYWIQGTFGYQIEFRQHGVQRGNSTEVSFACWTRNSSTSMSVVARMEQVFWQLNRVGNRPIVVSCWGLTGVWELKDACGVPGETGVDRPGRQRGSTLRVMVLFNKVRHACFRGSRANEIYKYKRI